MSVFSIRTWEDSLARMLGWVSSNPDLTGTFTDPKVQGVSAMATDLNTGSLEVANLEALAMAMEDYDVRAKQALDYAVSEAAYNAFGFGPSPAVQATGSVTFTAFAATLAPITIPAGFQVAAADGTQFVTTAPVVLLAGAFSVTAQVLAVAAGPGGNVPGGAIQRISYPIQGVDVVTNPSATWGGKDAESPANRATRFASWVSSLVRGTAPALEYAALVVAPTCTSISTGILAARAVEPSTLVAQYSSGVSSLPFSGISYAGLVWLFVDVGSAGGSLSTWPTIQAAVNTAVSTGGLSVTGQQVSPWKAAGVMVQVYPVTYQRVFVSATLRVSMAGRGRMTDIGTSLTNAALAYFTSLNIGDPVVYGDLLAAVGASDQDVLSVVSLTLGLAASPTGTSSIVLDPFSQVGYRNVTDSNALVWSFA